MICISKLPASPALILTSVAVPQMLCHTIAGVYRSGEVTGTGHEQPGVRKSWLPHHLMTWEIENYCADFRVAVFQPSPTQGTFLFQVIISNLLPKIKRSLGCCQKGRGGGGGSTPITAAAGVLKQGIHMPSWCCLLGCGSNGSCSIPPRFPFLFSPGLKDSSAAEKRKGQ